MKSKIILFQKQRKSSFSVKYQILAKCSNIYYFMPNFEFIKKSLYRYPHFFYFCLLIISHIIQCPVSESIPIVLNITKICVNVQCVLKYTYKKHKHT